MVIYKDIRHGRKDTAIVKTYYKVVKDMKSLHAVGEDTVVTYVPGEWTQPQPWAEKQGLGLWVCNSIFSARVVASASFLACQIWECEIDDVVQLKYVEWGNPVGKIRQDSYFVFSPLKETRFTSAMKVKLTTLVEEVQGVE